MLQAVYSLFSRNQKTIFLVFSIAILFFLDFDIGFADEVTASQKTVITVNSIYKIIAGIM
jgi:hypothetical protein